MNFSTSPAKFDANKAINLQGSAKLEFSNYSIENVDLGKTVELKGYEGRVYLLS
jgi:hypothetical protein